MVSMQPVPWEDEQLSFPANLGLTWWASLTTPRRFFRQVDWEGPFSRPLLYWLLLWIVTGALGLLWVSPELEALSTVLGEQGSVDSRLVQLLNFFMSPFAALAALAIGMVLHHLAALLLAPERRGIDATGRVICYAAGPLVVTPFPVPWMLDWLVTVAVWVWVATILVLGFREAHRTTTGRAGGIVAIPVVVLGLFTVLLVLGLAAILASLPELTR